MPLSAFQAVNVIEGSDYFDSLEDERQASAAIAIHMAWLQHSSSMEFFKTERLLPDSPVDMLLLYKATVETFAQWPPPPPDRELPSGGRVINLAQAEQRLRSLSDPRQAALASLFVSNVIRLSATSSVEQDVNYCLELFLRCIQQDGVIDRIASGAIKRHSDLLADPDYW
jgi:hypothetical protein